MYHAHACKRAHYRSSSYLPNPVLFANSHWQSHSHLQAGACAAFVLFKSGSVNSTSAIFLVILLFLAGRAPLGSSHLRALLIEATPEGVSGFAFCLPAFLSMSTFDVYDTVSLEADSARVGLSLVVYTSRREANSGYTTSASDGLIGEDDLVRSKVEGAKRYIPQPEQDCSQKDTEKTRS